jgi:hypothetical protein
MVRYSGDKAKKKNMDFNKRSSSYVQIKPSKGTSSDCEKSIALNFNNLEMTVFVKKENVGKAQDLLQIKLEKGASLTSETMKINTKSAETLQIKVEGKSWQNYVPVAL